MAGMGIGRGADIDGPGSAGCSAHTAPGAHFALEWVSGLFVT